MPWAVLKLRLHWWRVLHEEADGSVRHVNSMDFTEIANADADEGFGRGQDTLWTRLMKCYET